MISGDKPRTDRGRTAGADLTMAPHGRNSGFARSDPASRAIVTFHHNSGDPAPLPRGLHGGVHIAVTGSGSRTARRSFQFDDVALGIGEVDRRALAFGAIAFLHFAHVDA